MKKNVLSICLALALLAALLPQFAITASAKTVDSGTCGDGVNWIFTDDGLLTISGSGAMDDYTAGNETPWQLFRSTTNPPTRPVIQNIVVEDGVTHIGSYAFANFSYLKSVTIGADVASIGTNALRDSARIESFAVSADNQAYTAKDGVLFTKDGTTLLRFPPMKTGAYSIPRGTVTIAEDAFVSSSAVTSIQIPDSVTTLGRRAFGGCIAMTQVNIPEGITEIPERTFAECLALTSVRIPASVTAIDKQAFYGCTSLKEIAVCGNVSTVGDLAFSELCWGGVELTFAGTAPVFGSMVFDPMPVTAYYPGIDPTWTEEVRQDYGGQVTWVPYRGACPGGLACAGYAFTDMPAPSNWAHAGIEYAIENNITAGMSPTTFEPDTSCTRAHVVTFLWRAAGCPAPTTTECPFTDVSQNAFYYKAMLWAVENGITNGMTPTTFEPNTSCTRGQVVTFLYRAAGKPAYTADGCAFTDVRDGAFYYKAMMWAVENNVTKGMTATTFAPNDTCTRGQVVTFLYRAYN